MQGIFLSCASDKNFLCLSVTKKVRFVTEGSATFNTLSLVLSALSCSEGGFWQKNRIQDPVSSEIRKIDFQLLYTKYFSDKSLNLLYENAGKISTFTPGPLGAIMLE